MNGIIDDTPLVESFTMDFESGNLQRRVRRGPIRKLLAIPFLPVRDIPRAFEKLSDRVKASEPLRAVFKYVNDQWLESSVWSPEQWSVYRQSVRTNNDTEVI